MNESHKLRRKVNRVKRLARRILDVPADEQKVQRKNALTYELSKAGIKI